MVIPHQYCDQYLMNSIYRLINAKKPERKDALRLGECNKITGSYVLCYRWAVNQAH